MPKRSMETLTESMFYILMAFRTGAMCGIDMADFIARRTEGRLRMGPATLYTVLAKFEAEKYIRQISSDGHKRVYCITEKGMAAYRAEVERLRRCLSDAEKGGLLYE